MSFYDDPNLAWDASGQPASAPGTPRDLSMLRTVLTLLFVLVAVVSAMGAAAYANRAVFVSDVLDTSPDDPLASTVAVDADRILQANEFVGFGVLASGVLALALGVAFIAWQYRHAKNAQLLGSRAGFGPGWSIGGWFVPVANLVIPGRQLFVASKYSDADGRGARIVVAWWVCFVVAILVDRGAAAAGIDGPRADIRLREMMAADWTAVAGEGLFAVAAVLGLIMVRRLTERQGGALAELLQRQPQTPGPPAAPTSAAATPPPPSATPPPPSAAIPQPGASEVPAPPPVPPRPAS